MVQRVGVVGPHDLLLVRERGRGRSCCRRSRVGATTESRRAAASLSGGTGMPRRRNGDDRMRPAELVGRPVLDVGGRDEPAEAVAEQEDRHARAAPRARRRRKHAGVVEVVGEPPDVAAAAGREAVAAQVVDVHGVARVPPAPRQARGSGRRARRTRGPRRARRPVAPSGAPRPARQQQAVGAGELRRGVLHGAPWVGRHDRASQVRPHAATRRWRPGRPRARPAEAVGQPSCSGDSSSMGMRRYFTSGDLLGGRRDAVRQDYIRAGRRVAAPRPGATVSSEREGALGIGTHHRSTADRDAPARRGGASRGPPACSSSPPSSAPAPRRRPRAARPPPSARRRRPRRLATAGDAGGGAATGRTCCRSWPTSRRSRPPSPSSACSAGPRPARAPSTTPAGPPRSQRLGGPAVAAYNLGSRNRTLAQDVELVKALPEDAGHRLHRHQRRPLHGRRRRTPRSICPSRRSRCRRTVSTSTARARSSATPRRRRCSREWLAKRYPAFKKNYATEPQDARDARRRLQGARPARRCCSSCRATRRSSATPSTRRWPGSPPSCRALARKHGVPWVSFVSAATPAQRRLLRPLAPRRAGTRRVAGAASRQETVDLLDERRPGRRRRRDARAPRRSSSRPQRCWPVLPSAAAAACSPARRAPEPPTPAPSPPTDDAGRGQGSARLEQGRDPPPADRRQPARRAARDSPWSSCSAAPRRARARSTTRDWAAADPAASAAPTSLAYNLGCKHDTFALDREIVEAPAQGHAGDRVHRHQPRALLQPAVAPSVTLPDPRIPPRAYYQHIYSVDKRIQSASLKRYYVKYWLTARWPEFHAHYAYNLGVARERGPHLHGPRPAPGARSTCRATCRSSATRSTRPWRPYKAGCARIAARYGDPVGHVRHGGALRRRRLLRPLPPRRAGPRQVPAPALGEDGDAAATSTGSTSPTPDADAVAHADARRRRPPSRSARRRRRAALRGRRPQAAPARSDRAAEAAVLLEVLLVVVLGRPPLRRRHDLRDDGPAVAALRLAGARIASRAAVLLLRRVEEDRRAVLVAHVRALPVQLRRVVHAEERGQQLLVGDLVRGRTRGARPRRGRSCASRPARRSGAAWCRRCSRPRCECTPASCGEALLDAPEAAGREGRDGHGVAFLSGERAARGARLAGRVIPAKRGRRTRGRRDGARRPRRAGGYARCAPRSARRPGRRPRRRCSSMRMCARLRGSRHHMRAYHQHQPYSSMRS